MPKILIIDDDAAIQIVLRKLLVAQGYDVIVATSGREGAKMAAEYLPAVIICDWMMPGMNGLEVCRCIKADPELAASYFILLTSRTTVEDRVRGLDNGADDFLCKPIELDELTARVRAGLRLHQVNQDLQAQKRVLESEFNEAAEYVRSLLPPPMTGKLQIDSRFIPSRQLGGDCFDYYWLDPDYLAIYLLDVSGHGLGAALPSISVLNLLRSQSMDGVNFYQPNSVLRALNETFQMDNQNDKFFTIWYGVYNQVKRQLIYSSAGHPPAILLPKASRGGGPFVPLKTSSMPIGMLPDTRFVNQRYEIESSGILYIFSDGVYEIMQPDGNIWGLEAFVDLLVNDARNIDRFGLDYILERIKALNPKGSLDDDLSLLRIEFH
ncbi:PP2C family protein-serine/threonine phosphatase [Leptothermofonsia sp. ETS-13]|uniref:PP2C family protein-serine/threonine phosphatase n=1 Tax=Leptothermofonsia sp. ETS-13 TaxID=3035696 RepID=UPI003BA39DC1